MDSGFAGIQPVTLCWRDCLSNRCHVNITNSREWFPDGTSKVLRSEVGYNLINIFRNCSLVTKVVTSKQSKNKWKSYRLQNILFVIWTCAKTNHTLSDCVQCCLQCGDTGKGLSFQCFFLFLFLFAAACGDNVSSNLRIEELKLTQC